ncbi:unnamed protein product [Strongylus vulgaris]|uniref:Uncharacterized protein n=1 Tax=Strongylus vulgaris TaxID=40348 RepID=A0A3P7JIX2_STRVU|nr:unnamed protein product [Strongylus vulgaris]
MVAFLVTNGAQVEKRDVEGFTPLHVAAQFGATPVVGYLVARGQSVDAPDESRITPAMWAAAKVRQLILRTDCDLSATNRDNETALDIAVRRGDTVLISRMELAARRKGLMNSTWRQKITENKVRSSGHIILQL